MQHVSAYTGSNSPLMLLCTKVLLRFSCEEEDSLTVLPAGYVMLFQPF